MTTTKPTLKPCPMCGGEASHEGVVRYNEAMVKKDKLGQSEFYFCNCPRCGLSNVGITGFYTVDQAITAWNRREGQSVILGPNETDKFTAEQFIKKLSDLLPNYQSMTSTDQARRQMIEHLMEFSKQLQDNEVHQLRSPR